MQSISSLKGDGQSTVSQSSDDEGECVDWVALAEMLRNFPVSHPWEMLCRRESSMVKDFVGGISDQMWVLLFWTTVRYLNCFPVSSPNNLIEHQGRSSIEEFHNVANFSTSGLIRLELQSNVWLVLKINKTLPHTYTINRHQNRLTRWNEGWGKYVRYVTYVYLCASLGG